MLNYNYENRTVCMYHKDTKLLRLVYRHLQEHQGDSDLKLTEGMINVELVKSSDMLLLRFKTMCVLWDEFKSIFKRMGYEKELVDLVVFSLKEGSSCVYAETNTEYTPYYDLVDEIAYPHCLDISEEVVIDVFKDI